MSAWLAAAVALIAPAFVQHSPVPARRMRLPEPVDLPRLLDELVDRSELARFPVPEHTAFSRSTVTPKPAGADTAVLLDVAGPGVITRIAAVKPRGKMRIWLDDDAVGAAAGIETEPALVADLHALLSGAGPVASPLAAEHDGYGSLYLPIPFDRRVRVTLDDPAVAGHVEWRQYGIGTRVTSFARGDLERHAVAIGSAIHKWREIAAPVGEETFAFHLSRAAPESEFLGQGPAPTAGPRAVSEIRLRVDGVDDVAAALRDCRLHLAFDGREAVAVPLAAFFGVTDRLRPLHSWFLSVEPPGVLVARWVMPYEQRMSMRIENAGDPELHIAGVVRTIPWEWDQHSMHFRAAWRSSGPVSTRSGRVVPQLDVHPAWGVFVGDLFTVQNPVPEWWGAGGATILVDGRTSHWADAGDQYGFVAAGESFQAPLHGLARGAGPRDFGRTDVHRFRMLDAVPFRTAVRYEHEIVHAADTTIECASCVVFYARPGARIDALAPQDALPRLHVRRVAGAVEAETARVVAASEGLEHTLEAHRDLLLSGGLQRFVLARRNGEFLELEVPSEPGERAIAVLATRGGGHGILRFSIDGQPVGERFDGRNPAGPATVGPIEVALGQHRVGSTFRLRAEVVGTSVQTEGPQRFFGLDAIVVR